MPRIPITPSRQHSGRVQRVFGLPPGVSKYTLIITRTTRWPTRSGNPPESEVCRANVDISLDGGTTYVSGAGVGAIGGDIVSGKTGGVSPQTTLVQGIPGAGIPNRKVRVTIEARTGFTAKVDLDTE